MKQLYSTLKRTAFTIMLVCSAIYGYSDVLTIDMSYNPGFIIKDNLPADGSENSFVIGGNTIGYKECYTHSDGYLWLNGSKGTIYNKTDLGTIHSISITYHSSSAASGKINIATNNAIIDSRQTTKYPGHKEQLDINQNGVVSTSVILNEGFFNISVGTSTAVRITKIEISYTPIGGTVEEFDVNFHNKGEIIKSVKVKNGCNIPSEELPTLTEVGQSCDLQYSKLAGWVSNTSGYENMVNPTEPSLFNLNAIITANTDLYAVFSDESSSCVLVNDVSTLNINDVIVIASSTADKYGDFYALSSTQNSSNRGAAKVIKSGNDLDFEEDSGVEMITLESGTKTGGFAFKVEDGYLYAASSSSNQLKTKKAKDDKGSWEINITNGVGSIIAQTSAIDNIRNELRFNAGDILFSCYGSNNSMQDVAIYKYTKNITGWTACCSNAYIDVIPTDVMFGVTDPGTQSMKSIKISTNQLGENASLTLNDANGVFSFDKNSNVSNRTVNDNMFEESVEIFFNPSIEGTYTATLLIESATNGISKTINLKAEAYKTYSIRIHDGMTVYSILCKEGDAVSESDMPTIMNLCNDWAFAGYAESNSHIDTNTPQSYITFPYTPAGDVDLYTVYQTSTYPEFCIADKTAPAEWFIDEKGSNNLRFVLVQGNNNITSPEVDLTTVEQIEIITEDYGGSVQQISVKDKNGNLLGSAEAGATEDTVMVNISASGKSPIYFESSTTAANNGSYIKSIRLIFKTRYSSNPDCVSFHRVSFEGNDATNTKGSIHDVLVQPNRNIELPANKITHNAKYNFLHWNTKSDNSGTTYADNAIIPNINNDLILYAQWDMPFDVRKITALPATHLKNDGATANWSNVNGAASYEITYYPSTQSSLTQKVSGITGTHYDITGLDPLTEYTYHVTAIDNSGIRTTQSNDITFKTEALQNINAVDTVMLITVSSTFPVTTARSFEYVAAGTPTLTCSNPSQFGIQRDGNKLVLSYTALQQGYTTATATIKDNNGTKDVFIVGYSLLDEIIIATFIDNHWYALTGEHRDLNRIKGQQISMDDAQNIAQIKDRNLIWHPEILSDGVIRLINQNGNNLATQPFTNLSKVDKVKFYNDFEQVNKQAMWMPYLLDGKIVFKSAEWEQKPRILGFHIETRNNPDFYKFGVYDIQKNWGDTEFSFNIFAKKPILKNNNLIVEKDSLIDKNFAYYDTIFIRPNGKLICPKDINITASEIFIQADLNSNTGEISNKGGIITAVNGITLEKPVNDKQWYYFSVPFDCVIDSFRFKTITSGTGGPVGNNWEYGIGIGNYKDYIIRYYNQNTYSTSEGKTTGWTDYDFHNNALKAGQGYELGLIPAGSEAILYAKSAKNHIIKAPISKTLDFGSGHIWHTPTPKDIYAGWNVIGTGLYESMLYGDITYSGGTYNGNPMNMYVSMPNKADITQQTYIQKRIDDARNELTPFYSFFVQVGSNAAPEFRFNVPQGAPRRSAAALISREVTIELKGQNGLLDQTTIIADDNASTQYEIGVDLLKLTGYSSYPQIYTFDAEGNNLAFNGQPLSKGSMIPLGIYIPKKGIYTFKISENNKNTLGQIILHDKISNSYTDITDTEIKIELEQGIDNGRFEIILLGSPIITSINSNTDVNDNPIVYVIDGNLHLENVNETSNIYIYDSIGRIIYIGGGNREYRFNSRGVYSIVIIDKNNRYTQKVIY